MLPYFLLVVAVLLTLVLVLGQFLKANPTKLASALRKGGGIALLVGAALLAARGLFIYAIPVAVFGYSLLTGRNPFTAGFPGRASKSAGQQSRVRTGTIEMRLDHDSGDMEGMVLKGRFANRMLSDLSLQELLELLLQCSRDDAQAAQLLEAYLDRVHPEWREAAGAAKERGDASAKAGGGPMTTEEAYEILGLDTGASAADIRKAHRTLMKKLHPDHGGSTYLAAKINQAKDLLLGRTK